MKTTNFMNRITCHLLIWMSCLFYFFPSGICADAPESPLTLMDAVLQTISATPDILLAKQTVSYYEAEIQAQKGAQDPVLSLDISQDVDDEPLSPYYQSIYHKEAEETENLTTTLTVEKEFENGITLESYLELERMLDNVTSYPADNYATAVFEITFPVLKLIEHGSGSREIPSEIELKAGIRDLAATISKSVESTSVAFWDALAQKKILGLYATLESESRRFLDDMRILSEKQEYPAANLALLEADAEAKAIQRISQEQSLFAAKQTLALIIGVDTTSLEVLPEIAGAFPEPVLTSAGIKDLIFLAKKQRDDLAAEKIRADYYEKLVEEAKKDLLPDVDLTLQVSYKGLDETSAGKGYYQSIDKNMEGPSYMVGLSYSVPLGNNTSKGNLTKATINLKKEQITIARLERGITSDVLTGFKAYQNSIRVLEKQKYAVKIYKSALDNETLKFKYQMENLSDRLSAAESYAQSLVGLIDKQKTYAVALIQLRQACGTLIAQVDEKFHVNEADLLSPISPSQVN
jgi:outer membrane protein TolC